METKKYQLPREFATKWVEALRNKHYVQIKGNYCSSIPFCYCAIGLGAHINNMTVGHQIIEGINLVVPVLMENEITSMNDDGKSFREIADWIQQNVEFI